MSVQWGLKYLAAKPNEILCKTNKEPMRQIYAWTVYVYVLLLGRTSLVALKVESFENKLAFRLACSEKNALRKVPWFTVLPMIDLP